MIPNNNLSILPFYRDIEQQNHRKSYSDGIVYPLLTKDRTIPPFQIIRETRTNQFVDIFLKKVTGETIADIKSDMISTGLKINRYESDGYDIIKYPSYLQIATNTPEGQYYIFLSDGVEGFYSDIFTISNTNEDCLLITYWDNQDLEFTNGRVDYQDSFKNKIYLDTQIGRPEYVFEENVDNRDGYIFTEKQISEKTFKFNFIAPEYLCDAMRIIRMSDNVEIYSLGNNYTVDTFLMTPTWESGGFLASVEAEFQCDTVIKKTGKTYIIPDGGDFNNDFNNDFKIN